MTKLVAVQQGRRWGLHAPDDTIVVWSDGSPVFFREQSYAELAKAHVVYDEASKRFVYDKKDEDR